MSDLRKTPVADIMTEEVLTLSADATLDEAIAVLRDSGITGAPVVDDAGECVGVFTLADLARRDEEVEGNEAPRAASYFNFGVTEKLALAAEDYDPEMFDRETVGDWMSTAIESIPLGVTAGDAAKAMAAAKIHRVLVLDGKTIRGIVTAYDMVRLLAGEVEAKAAKPAKAPKAATPRAKARRAPARRKSSA